jgi:hypothetical protein
MKRRTKYIISGVTGLVMVYVLTINLGVNFGLIFFLFLITTVGLFWMVYAILTDDSNLSSKTFDDYYYEDTDPKS